MGDIDLSPTACITSICLNQQTNRNFLWHWKDDAVFLLCEPQLTSTIIPTLFKKRSSTLQTAHLHLWDTTHIYMASYNHLHIYTKLTNKEDAEIRIHVKQFHLFLSLPHVTSYFHQIIHLYQLVSTCI